MKPFPLLVALLTSSAFLVLEIRNRYVKPQRFNEHARMDVIAKSDPPIGSTVIQDPQASKDKIKVIWLGINPRNDLTAQKIRSLNSAGTPILLATPKVSTVPATLRNEFKTISWKEATIKQLNAVYAPRWYVFQSGKLVAMQSPHDEFESSLAGQP